MVDIRQETTDRLEEYEVEINQHENYDTVCVEKTKDTSDDLSSYDADALQVEKDETMEDVISMYEDRQQNENSGKDPEDWAVARLD